MGRGKNKKERQRSTAEPAGAPRPASVPSDNNHSSSPPTPPPVRTTQGAEQQTTAAVTPAVPPPTAAVPPTATERETVNNIFETPAAHAPCTSTAAPIPPIASTREDHDIGPTRAASLSAALSTVQDTARPYNNNSSNSPSCSGGGSVLVAPSLPPVPPTSHTPPSVRRRSPPPSPLLGPAATLSSSASGPCHPPPRCSCGVWPFHGDVYAHLLGQGEVLFPEGLEDPASDVPPQPACAISNPSHSPSYPHPTSPHMPLLSSQGGGAAVESCAASDANTAHRPQQVLRQGDLVVPPAGWRQRRGGGTADARRRRSLKQEVRAAQPCMDAVEKGRATTPASSGSTSSLATLRRRRAAAAMVEEEEAFFRTNAHFANSKGQCGHLPPATASGGMPAMNASGCRDPLAGQPHATAGVHPPPSSAVGASYCSTTSPAPGGGGGSPALTSGGRLPSRHQPEEEEEVGVVPHELWRFRRRGFQDCWMTIFFCFVMLLALLACGVEVHSLALTPAMRREMEAKWGLCEVDFAALHVRKHVRRFISEEQEASFRRRQQQRVGAISGDSSSSGKGSAVSTNSKESQGRSGKHVREDALAAMRVENRFYKRVSRQVTFHAWEALVVGLDYTLCLRVPGSIGYKEEVRQASEAAKRGDTDGSGDEEEPIVLEDGTVIDMRPDEEDEEEEIREQMEEPQVAAPRVLPSQRGTPGSETESARGGDVAPELYWQHAQTHPGGGLSSNRSAGSSTGVVTRAPQDVVVVNSRPQREAQDGPAATPESGAPAPVPVADRPRRRPIQEILDQHSLFLPLFAMEWQPLVIFEVALLLAIPCALLCGWLLITFSDAVLPVILAGVVLCSVLAGGAALFLWGDLFLALAVALGGLVTTWWWWMHGAARQPLAAELLRFTGDIFFTSSASAEATAVESQSRGGTGSSRLGGHRRFFFFSLAAAVLHVIDLTIITVALLPPFFRLAATPDPAHALTLSDIAYVLLILLSNYWLLNVLYALLDYLATGLVLVLYYSGRQYRPPATPLKDLLGDAFTTHMGSLCFQALFLTPAEAVYHLLCWVAPPPAPPASSRVSRRRLWMDKRVADWVQDEEEEAAAHGSFIGRSACRARCYWERRVLTHVNRFALIHVVLYGCGYEEAAQHTWALVKGLPSPILPPEAVSSTGVGGVIGPAGNYHYPPHHHLHVVVERQRCVNACNTSSTAMDVGGRQRNSGGGGQEEEETEKGAACALATPRHHAPGRASVGANATVRAATLVQEDSSVMLDGRGSAAAGRRRVCTAEPLTAGEEGGGQSSLAGSAPHHSHIPSPPQPMLQASLTEVFPTTGAAPPPPQQQQQQQQYAGRQGQPSPLFPPPDRDGVASLPSEEFLYMDRFLRSLRHQLLPTTMHLTVNLVLSISSTLIALGTWWAMRWYLQRTHHLLLYASADPDSTANASTRRSGEEDPTFSFATSPPSSTRYLGYFFVGGNDPHEKSSSSTADIDLSSLAVALSVFLSCYCIHRYYFLLVFDVVWRVLCLSSIESPAGLQCSFPRLFDRLCVATKKARIWELSAPGACSWIADTIEQGWGGDGGEEEQQQHEEEERREFQHRRVDVNASRRFSAQEMMAFLLPEPPGGADGMGGRTATSPPQQHTGAAAGRSYGSTN